MIKEVQFCHNELKQQVKPMLLSLQNEIKPKDELRTDELLFEMIVNNQLFGTPLLKRLLANGSTYRFILTRQDALNCIMAIRIDYLNPPLTWKISMLNELCAFVRSTKGLRNDRQIVNQLLNLLHNRGKYWTSMRNKALRTLGTPDSYRLGLVPRVSESVFTDPLNTELQHVEAAYLSAVVELRNLLIQPDTPEVTKHFLLLSYIPSFFVQSIGELRDLTFFTFLCETEKSFILQDDSLRLTLQQNADLMKATIEDASLGSKTIVLAPHYGANFKNHALMDSILELDDPNFTVNANAFIDILTKYGIADATTALSIACESKSSSKALSQSTGPDSAMTDPSDLGFEDAKRISGKNEQLQYEDIQR
jgi:hypothetical protein